jgi:hypothetical protein
VLERAWPILPLVRRWLPKRAGVCVADSRVAALEWRALVAPVPRVRVITRRRLDAALDAPPRQRAPGTTGRPRLTGTRRPTLEAVWVDEQTPWRPLPLDDWSGAGRREVEVATDTAGWDHAGKPPVASRWGLLRAPHACCHPPAWWSTHREPTREPRLAWLVRRGTLDVTCADARAHLGLATPRPWTDQAMARATPARLSLDSLMTRTAPLRIDKGATGVRSAAWSDHTRPTCSAAMAWVRRHVWEHLHCSLSPQATAMLNVPRALLERFTDALCDAA